MLRPVYVLNHQVPCSEAALQCAVCQPNTSTSSQEPHQTRLRNWEAPAVAVTAALPLPLHWFGWKCLLVGVFASFACVCMGVGGYMWVFPSTVLCCKSGWQLKAEASEGERGDCQRAPELQGGSPDPSCPELAAACRRVPGFLGLPGPIPGRIEGGGWKKAKNNVWPYIKKTSRDRQCWVIWKSRENKQGKFYRVPPFKFFSKNNKVCI